MPYKFEKLEAWKLALDYVDSAYAVTAELPPVEQFNLRSQMIRAATSVALNLAEGSTGQTDTEFSRFVGLAIRSLIETVACRRILERRGYTVDPRAMAIMESQGEILFSKLQALRRRLDPEKKWVRDPGDKEWANAATEQDVEAADRRRPTADDSRGGPP